MNSPNYIIYLHVCMCKVNTLSADLGNVKKICTCDFKQFGIRRRNPDF